MAKPVQGVKKARNPTPPFWGDGQGLRLAALAAAGLLGTAWQLQQPRLWSTALDAALLIVAPLLLLVGWRLRRHRGAFVLALAALAALGAANASLQARARLADALAPELERQPVELTGLVAELPQDSAEGLRFVLAVEQARRADGTAAAVPHQVSLAWSRGGPDEPALSAPGTTLRAGQRWRLWARLQAPHALLNPHGFDGELWLFERGIRATGSVRAEPAAPRLLDEAAGYPIQRARQRVRDAIEAQVDDARAAGVLAALAVGDQAAIDRADWALFRATGTAHLMAISGLHITMFAWPAALAVGAAWRRGPVLRWWPAPRAALWGGVALAAAYALLAGWGVPAQRTVWMLASAALLQALGLHWPWPLRLMAAALVVGALDPWALLQPGFWLSFAAVGLLMASEPARPAVSESTGAAADAPADSPAVGLARRGAALLRAGLRTQLIATVGLAPLTLLLFQQVSVVGLAANLLAIPLVTLVITPLALLGVLWAPLWSVAAALLSALVAVLSALAAVPGAVWSAAAAPAWVQAAGLLAGLLLVVPLPWRLRLLGLPLLLPLVLPPPQRPPPGQFEVLAADVGQGSAVLIRTHDSLLLYDSGPQYGPGRDAGQRVLTPLLQALGERRIDTLVLSHRDMDHAGGGASLLAAFPVGELLSSLEPQHPLRQGGTPHRRCEAGQQWQRDGVSFTVLHPGAAAYAQPRLPTNALSCVLQVRDAAGRRLLLTGDIGAAQEAALLERDPAALRSALLLVPHHGSRGSSSAGFVDAVSPAVAVIQAGHHNRFGHPAPEVVQRLQALGTEVVQSPDCGAWHWRDGQAACERALQPRYWRHRLR
ncbi:DNA internalization-related competence protein ComEC/Rec2 [Azohydromonas caseinilytica]|uniref:DNA internalization-related competence protein ComEC/Rec2 n=1 Tax=Azohydromonas caseinilytica TaxID=2728836 RepID=A0A848FEL3_9BURK|nr:DNA internalization-related competence protein ComEC/Rec2 [Azohydromonas caseinilytica]NML17506.1 DNA internalization-related competence protein ComEC/Rec2 [Azohydromonas caseinilytica]